ncbi:MAG: Rab geranylgeranyltransferase [Trichoglossum hirsutum]|nr:MAG: Rab geranylgeranyltransferase [Trichoglossum hirsutum]
MTSHGVPRPANAHPARTEQARAKELTKIEDYRALVSLVQTKIAEREYTADVLALTSKLLIWNPEYYTIWNHRRRILLHGLFPPPNPSSSPSLPDAEAATAAATATEEKTHKLLLAELSFLLPLFLTHPKAYTLWTHRIWLLRHSLSCLPRALSHPLWADELVLCNRLLALDPRNFHGWAYRKLVGERLESMDPAGAVAVVEREFGYANRMVEANLSNFSAWHARAGWGVKALEVRRAGADERLRFFEDELSLITRALYTDPYDQSLWFYHTYLLLTTCSPKSPATTAANKITTLTPTQKSHYLRHELASLRDLLEEGVDDCKWVYEALVVYGRMAGRVGGEGAGEEEVREWLGKLEQLDPLRKGRWRDWAKGVGVLE